MKAKLLALACLLLSGCVNLYTRSPFTGDRIEETYQSTQYAALFSWVVMFPQTMAPGGSRGLMWANAVSVPVGCLCFVDAAAEAAVDTVCFPADLALSGSRKKYGMGIPEGETP